MIGQLLCCSKNKFYPCVHCLIDSHTVPHSPLSTALSLNPATDYSTLQPLLMKAAALTTIPQPHHLTDSNQHTFVNIHQ